MKIESKRREICYTSAKQAAKALHANIPAKEIAEGSAIVGGGDQQLFQKFFQSQIVNSKNVSVEYKCNINTGRWGCS